MTLWEILKANKTGIAPDMFTMLAASKMNGENKNFIERVFARDTYAKRSYTTAHIGYIRINYETNYQLSNVQVNLGSTALPYEPYGYKIPVATSADGTEPIESIPNSV